MKQKIVGLWKIIKQTCIDFVDNGTTRMSAALAYYTFFSLAPILLIVIAVCDIFYGREAIEGNLYAQIQKFVGTPAATQIQEIIKNAAISSHITFASVLGGAALLFSATGVFTEIQSSINTIWQIKAKPKKGWLKFLWNRVLSLSMVLGLGFVLLVSLVVSALLDALMDRLLTVLPEGSFVFAYIINLLLTFTIISFLFGIIFKLLPDAIIKWKDVRAGAFTTAILFMLGKFAIGFYLGKSNPGGTYGAAGSVVIILLWVYYSSIILYFGATFTKVYAQHTGRKIYPDKYAVFIQQVELQNEASLQEQAEKKIIVEETTTPIA
jgi:membrane protein